MNLFLDSTIFFDAIETKTRIFTILQHAKNDGHQLVTSLTVYGEIVWVCQRDKRPDDIHKILYLINQLSVQCSLPNIKLRECCKCLDKMDKSNWVGLSDRTHLAYSISYGDDYFVTSDKNLLNFSLDSNRCRRCDKKTKIISPEQLKIILNS